MRRSRLVLLPKYFLPTTGGLQNATARIGAALQGLGWSVSALFPAAGPARPIPVSASAPFAARSLQGSRESFWSRVPDLISSDFQDTAVLAVGLEYEEAIDAQIWALNTLRERGARSVLRVATSGDIADRVTPERAVELARIDGTVVLNREMEHEALCIGEIGAKVHRIPVMVDPDRYRPDQGLRVATRQATQIDLNRQVVLCAGRLDPRKRLEMVVEAMQGVDALLWIVGDPLTADGDEATRLAQQAQDLGVLETRIDRGVPESEMPALLAAADLFVTASGREGMSNAVLEAASSGLAIAAFEIPGVQETATALANAGFYLAHPGSGASGLRASIVRGLAEIPEGGWRPVRESMLDAFSTQTVSATWNALLGAGI